MIDKKNILTLVLALAVLGLLASFYSDQNKDQIKTAKVTLKTLQAENKGEQPQPKDLTQAAVHDHDHKDKESDSPGELKAYPESFDFKLEKENLDAFKKSYPESKRKILDFILNKNKYSAAQAHSAAELAQRQVGALKVEALKILFDQEKDKAVLKQDLLLIAERAEDPVMGKIAQSALRSLEQGRPFFSDTVKALENLPIPD